MVQYRADAKAKLRRQLTQEAITLALKGHWEEAIAANRAVIESFPTDVDAHNRLGKAQAVMGRYQEARESYRQALTLDPLNSIARKNLERLRHLKEPVAPPGDVTVEPHIFIEETGKTMVTTLDRPAPEPVLAKMAAGDLVNLKAQGQRLTVENSVGETLGEVSPRLGLRLIKLMEGGNQYSAAIAGVKEDGIKVLLREVFQHPSQDGNLSFPAPATAGFRPYIKESILKHEDEEEHSTETWGEEPASFLAGETSLEAEEEREQREDEEGDEEGE